MPKETFWDSSTAVEGDDSEPVLTVTWGAEQPGVQLNGIDFDRSGLNRLIQTLRRSRNATYGADEGSSSGIVITVHPLPGQSEALIGSVAAREISEGLRGT